MNEEKVDKTKDTEKGKIDLILEWDESAGPKKREAGDFFDGSGEPVEPAKDVIQKVAETVSEELKADEFQWSEDLDRAIEESLDQANESPAPGVHFQLGRIRLALETGSITPEKGNSLLDEVDQYLERHIQKRRISRSVDNEEMQKARSLVMNALTIYSESLVLLREYIETQNPYDLLLSQRLNDHAMEFILDATDTMLELESKLFID